MIPTTEVKKLRAYNGDKKLKTAMVAEVLKHQKADRIIRGTYGNSQDGGQFRGCAVGCSIHSLNSRFGKKISNSDHKAYERELGIPQSLALLEDTLFERMPKADAMKWPVEFLKAIPVGADLSLVAPQFIVATLKDVVKLEKVKGDVAVVKAVLEVAKLWEQVIAGKEVKSAAWSAAWSAARSAAESAARSAAWSAAESAARSAAWSAARSAAWSAAESAAWSAAESAAESAAWSAAESAAESAARSAAYYKMSRTLLRLLKKAK